MSTYINRTITKTYTAADTIDINASHVFVGGGSATTLVLPDPPNTPAFDSKELVIKIITTHAHKIDNSSGSGFNGGGASLDFANFAGLSAEEFLKLVAYNGIWYTIGDSGITIAAT